ncbi:MAG TPA: hypothetical protein VF384_17095 [Planctomycetota bacterium]
MQARLDQATAFLLAAALTIPAIAQAPDPAPARGGRRLVYEMPIDAMQRQLQREPKGDLEQMLVRTVTAVAARVGREVTVRRDKGGRFTVDVPPHLVPQVPALRRRIEVAGVLEMRIVADAGFVDGDVRFDLQAEGARLEAWLAKAENKQLLREDARSIRRFNADPKQGPLQSGNLAWHPRVLRPHLRHKERWDVSWTTYPALKHAVVKAYDDEQWNDGRIPDAVLGQPEEQQFLIELVAVNMRQRAFTNDDFDPAGFGISPGPGPEFCVTYAIRDDLAAEYSRWTEMHIGKSCAMTVYGLVGSAPCIQSMLPARGEFSGGFTREAAEELEVVLSSGPIVPPAFVAEEPLPASEPGQRRE